MAATDHLSPAQFYHGTRHRFAVGDLVEPGHAVNTPGAARPDRTGHVYAASNEGDASFFGTRTYEVEPTGHMEIDPELVSAYGAPTRPEQATHWRSKQSMRVTRSLNYEDS